MPMKLIYLLLEDPVTLGTVLWIGIGESMMRTFELIFWFGFFTKCIPNYFFFFTFFYVFLHFIWYFVNVIIFEYVPIKYKNQSLMIKYLYTCTECFWALLDQSPTWQVFWNTLSVCYRSRFCVNNWKMPLKVSSLWTATFL